MLRDNLEFFSQGCKVVFNHYSFTELIKQIIVTYASKTYEQANQLVNSSFLVNEPTCFDDVTFYTIELEYHWAMLVTYGEMYWLKGIASDPNEFQAEYDAWVNEVMQTYNIKESYCYIDLE